MGDVIFTIIGFYIAKQLPFASILLIVVLEIILWQFKANFLKLSFGSLLKTHNFKYDVDP